jgi:hypothetical protein
MDELRQREERESAFDMFSKINVNDHVEKKNGLSYLSWAWAVSELLKRDPHANWRYEEPVRFGETMMVFCTVTAFSKSMTAQLPVMDHRNKAIPNPDAFQVNTAMQRCLAKAIALHGLGLYIYAGEDLPEEAKNASNAEYDVLLAEYKSAASKGMESLAAFHQATKSAHKAEVWKDHGKELKEIAGKV